MSRIKEANGGSAVFDQIVLAAGWKSDQGLLTALQGKVAGVFVIGDAVKPRETLEAVHEAKQLSVTI